MSNMPFILKNLSVRYRTLSRVYLDAYICECPICKSDMKVYQQLNDTIGLRCKSGCQTEKIISEKLNESFIGLLPCKKALQMIYDEKNFIVVPDYLIDEINESILRICMHKLTNSEFDNTRDLKFISNIRNVIGNRVKKLSDRIDRAIKVGKAS